MKKSFNSDSAQKIDAGYIRALSEIKKTQSALSSGLQETTKYYNEIERLGNLISNGKVSNLLQKAKLPQSIAIFNKYQADIFNKIAQAKSSIDGVKRFTGLIKEKIIKKKGGDEAWFNQSDPNFRSTNNKDKGFDSTTTKANDETKQITNEYDDTEKKSIATINETIKGYLSDIDTLKNKPENETIAQFKENKRTQINGLKNDLNNIIEKAKKRNSQNKIPANRAVPSGSAPEVIVTPPIHTPDDSVANQTEWVDIKNGLSDKIFKGWTSKGKNVAVGTLNQPTWERNSREIARAQSLPGSFKFYIEKLHGYDNQGEPYKANKISNNPEEYKKFSNRMLFPVFLDTWSDAFTANWNTIDLIGKSEPIRVYNNTTRQLTIDFYILADFSAEIMLAGIQELQEYASQISNEKKNNREIRNNSDFTNEENKFLNKKLSPQAKQVIESNMTLSEQKQAHLQLQAYTKNFQNIGHGSNNIPEMLKNGVYGFTPSATTSTPEMLWNRMTFLAQCCYPYYRQDGKLKENPIIKLRIGDFFDVVCYITSLSINDMEMGWDLNYSPNIGVIPMGAKVSMSLDIIHQQTPSSTYSRFYHRKDYDNYDNPYSYIPETLKNSLTKDYIIDKLIEDNNFRQKILGNEINISSVQNKIGTGGPTRITEDGENFTSIDTMWPETVLYDIPNSSGSENKSKDGNYSNIQDYAENISKLSEKLNNFNFKTQNNSVKKLINKNQISETLNISKRLLTAKEKMKNLKIKDNEKIQEINKLANEFVPLVKKTFDIANNGFNINNII